MSTPRPRCLIPTHMVESARLWAERAEPHPRKMGAFLRAVLCNDLVRAYLFADDVNARAMREWAAWLYGVLPSGAWGSMEKLEAWHAKEHAELAPPLGADPS